MAFEIIGKYPIYEWEQQEIIEDDVLQQDYVKVVAELIVKQERNTVNNTSTIRGELWGYFSAGANGDGVSVSLSASTNKLQHYPNIVDTKGVSGGFDFVVAPGETERKLIREFMSSSNYLFEDGNTNTATVIFECVHNLDGTLTQILTRLHTGYHGVGTRLSYLTMICDFQANVKSKTLVSGEVVDNYNHACRASNSRQRYVPLSINRALVPITADNFTDEENPSFTYNAVTGRSTAYDNTNDALYGVDDYIISCQVALSFDGVTIDVPWREISTGNNNYVFELTEADRELLRVKAQGSPNVPIYYLTKITRQAGGGSINGKNIITQMPIEFINVTQRTLTIVGAYPTLNPKVEDANVFTTALTGNPNVFVRYESIAQFETGAQASKGAVITSQSVQNGSQIVKDMEWGLIDKVESNQFIFDATDSRGLSADRVVISTTMIDYIKPNIKVGVDARLTAETEVTLKFKVSGNCYIGSFGVYNNILEVDLDYKPEGAEQWISIRNVQEQLELETEDNSFSFDLEVSELHYAKSYTYRATLRDSLNTVITQEYEVRLLPIFDWSETDFNFNVPIMMNGETVLRHNKTANNTVLSASGGYIYIRPGGTDDTSGETTIYPDGSIKFGGIVDFDESINIGGNTIADFVIASGEESMGSNGTWRWQKWASGKAECWGCRNFGNMAITTAWGNLYRGAILTQDLPEDLFARTPDSININIVHGNYGGWICKHENTAPSAITTGSFIFVRPASATVSPTNIGFYVIGEWE